MFRISLLLYSFIYTLGMGVYLPILLYGKIRGSKRTVLTPRLGLKSHLDKIKLSSNRPRIWIHAVSVGEVNAIRKLALRLANEGLELYISTTTQTGQKIATELFSQKACIFYFPVDLRTVCNKYFKHIRPNIILLAETEIWPNFLMSAYQRQIPTVLVNGRISDTSFKSYSRFGFFFKSIFKRVSHFCMQSRLDKERALQLGAGQDKVNWVGNLKYDYTLDTIREKELLKDRLNKVLRAGPNSFVWLCGSTKPGEEVLLISVFKQIRSAFPELRLLLAPRHPQRGNEVAELARGQELTCLRRSEIDFEKEVDSAPDVIVLDSIGELAHLYQIADVVFIGGSLVPTGGQNVIEPAACGKPIIFGPHMENFREIANEFVKNYAALQVSCPEDLRTRLEDLIKDGHARKWLGQNARKVIRNNRGAVERTIEIVQEQVQATRPAKTIPA